MVKIICIFETNNQSVIEVNPSDQLNTLLKKLEIKDNYSKFVYNGMTYSIESKMTFGEIGIVSGDTIFIKKNLYPIAGDSKSIKLSCKLGTNNIKVVEVYPSDHIYVLLKKLDLKDKNSKFTFKGCTYSISSIMTFEEIGILSDCRIFIFNQFIG